MESELTLTVALCCYNSESRIEETLKHLCRQNIEKKRWLELLVIDNVCTDRTVERVKEIWKEAAEPVLLKVIREDRQGAGFARCRALNEASGDVLVFVDDDTWLEPDYLRIALARMESRKRAGAIGGLDTEKCETSPPEWFERYKQSYAVGPQGKAPGRINQYKRYLVGAGLVVRVRAWREVANQLREIVPLCAGREAGQIAGAGEDAEICLMLDRAGWNLFYEPELRLIHFLPARRLTWHYFLELRRGFGTGLIRLAPLRFLFASEDSLKKRAAQNWICQILLSGSRWGFYSAAALFLSAGFSKMRREAQSRAAGFEGMTLELWRQKGIRDGLIRMFQKRHAPAIRQLKTRRVANDPAIAQAEKTYDLPNGKSARLDDVVYAYDYIFEKERLYTRTKWMGIDFQQNPNDAIVIQEILWETKPDLIIETGTASGGSALFFASLMNYYNPEGRVLTMDINSTRLGRAQENPLWKKQVTFIKGDSTAPETFAEILRILKEIMPRTVLVNLDGSHESGTVLEEMKLYGPLVSPNSYMIVQDTKLDRIYPGLCGPMHAIKKFFALAESRDFAVDPTREYLYYSQHHGGYLRKKAST